MRAAQLGLAIGLALAVPTGVARADVTPELTRLDLSLPDLPAIVDLDLSSDKVTRPSTVRDLAASLATGFSADGSFHDGVALEAAPLALAGVGPAELRRVRISIATVGSTKAGVTVGKAAVGLRWSAGVYDPNTDQDLRNCLVGALVAPVLPGTMPIEHASPEPTPLPAGLATAAVANQVDSCRARFKAAHLAQSGVEIAAVLDGTTANELRLQDLSTPHGSAWISASFAHNSYGEPSAAKKQDPSKAYGLQPTLLGRFDFTDAGGTTSDDIFVGVRVPVMWDGVGLFGEYGLTLKDITSATAAGRTHVQRVGGGMDLRVADGSWLGVYIGQDIGPGSPGFSVFSNIKFSFGETRKYPLN